VSNTSITRAANNAAIAATCTARRHHVPPSKVRSSPRVIAFCSSQKNVTEFSREEKLKEIAREIALRRRVYPNRVMTHRLSKAAADRQIAIMVAIAKDYGGHGDEQ
jgi:hypothetical protein